MEEIGGQVRGHPFLARQKRVKGGAGDKAVAIGHHPRRVLPQRVVDRPALRHRAAVAVDMDADFIDDQVFDLVHDTRGGNVAVEKLKRHDVAENVDICHPVKLLDCVKLSILHFVHPLPSSTFEK